jgi:NIMA (never in mitosis gene a)-related kinase
MMDARSREKCLKEIRLLQSLNHPNIIRYIDSYIDNNELIIVLEFAEGGDLKGYASYIHISQRDRTYFPVQSVVSIPAIIIG